MHHFDIEILILSFANVPLDTNHLEREIRPIAVGRKNWMSCSASGVTLPLMLRFSRRGSGKTLS